MWGGPGPDPGGTNEEGTSSGPPSNQELIDLKDQFEQQQVLIAQLKEMLRKTEQTTVTQEKVEEYANTLTRMSARARKSKLQKEGGDGKTEIITVTTKNITTIDTPAKEKIMLLRQQVEQNKQKLAERGKLQKGIEETVTQLKAQFDDSQHLISPSPLNLSLTENYNVNSNPEELFHLVATKDRRIAELNVRIQKLEANVIDLQENVKEKDSVIDARTKAITLMSENLCKKGKNTLDELDDTKEQMRKMQENFVVLEMEIKSEKNEVVVELEQKNAEIVRLQEANSILEKTCSQQETDIAQLKASLEKYKSDLANYELKSADSAVPSNTEDLLSQIKNLNNRIAELEEVNAGLQAKPADIAPRDSPQRSSKKGKKGQKLQKSKSKESIDESSAKINDLQKILDDAKIECVKYSNKITEYELTVTELNLMIDELKSQQEILKAVRSDTAQGSEEVLKLKKQLDENNKSMIKIKAQHKGKVKELNKKMDELKKAGGGSEEVLRLQTENSRLSERVDILEEAKANLGLDASCSSTSKDLAVTERVKELEIKLMEQSELVDSRNQSITALEEQIKSYKTNLETLNERFEKLSHLENAKVVSEITSIHFEEQLDQLEIERQQLLQEKESVILEKEALLEKIEALAKDKQEMANKLDSYVQENMELTDKLDKLSAEKGSSAESIEIVEGFTQQDKLELEAYQKSLEMTSDNIKHSDENLEQNPELNESVNQLTEETSDLLRKIELFTEERREVMEKMEALNAENNQLNVKIHEVENNRDILAETYEQLQNDKEDLENKMDQNQEKVKSLEAALKELRNENEILKGKLDDYQIKHGSEVEETVKLETVAPLKSANEVQNLDLQKQIDEYKSLVEIQRQEIQELKVQLLSGKDLSKANSELSERITSLQTQYETLLSENEKLNKTIKENSELIHEKDAIESDLIAARKRISEFDETLTNNLNEIENYKSIVEENKDELISSANIINDLQSKLEEKQNEVSHHQNEILHLNSVIAELTSAVSHLEKENRQNSDNNDTIDLMSNQLQELKALLNENIKKIECYEDEMEQNSNTVSSLNTQLTEMRKKLLEMEHNLECKDDEIKKLMKERDNKETVIANLQGELRDKDENFHRVCESLKEKYLTLQVQIEQNTGSLDNIQNPLSKIEELENKNKEQLEKMKKIAANLKKKTAAYNELETKYKQTNEKWETEEKEKSELREIVQAQETKMAESQNKIDSLLGQLNELEKEFSAVQSTLTVQAKELSALNEEMSNLKKQNEELRNLKQSYEIQLNGFMAEAEMCRSDESNTLNMEINEKNEIIHNLNQELESTRYHSETNSNALHAKIQELEMFIENQETEITQYKEKINRLEEGLSNVEERRMSLEQKAIELGTQLQEKSNSFEEISQTEDILEQRLAALKAHDYKIQKHLQETIMENQELIERNRFVIEENNELKHKLSAATERNISASTHEEQLTDLQNENLRLGDTVITLENDIKRAHVEHEKRLNQKNSEVEAMEVELQGQLVQLDNERKTLLVQCEQLRDQLKEYSDTQEILKDEMELYKQKLEQQQTDFDSHMFEFQRISDENKNNFSIIEQLTSQLEIAKSPTVENLAQKVEKLEHLLVEKNSAIECYQQQNMQLQMQGGFNQQQQFEVFAETLYKADVFQSDLQVVIDELKTVKNQLVERDRVNSELLEKVSVLEQQNQEYKTTKEVQKPTPEQAVSTFVWPEQVNDPFAFVIDPAGSSSENIEPTMVQTKVEGKTSTHISENTKEELLNKIKALEFLLYDTVKEKDDILLQCRELAAEIALTIHEPQSTSQLESQICLENDMKLMSDERQQLKDVEFAPAKDLKKVEESGPMQPVVEEVIEASNAYLCYKPEAHEADNLSPRPQVAQGAPLNLESQIVQTAGAEITQEDRKRLHNVEFEKTKPCQEVADLTKALPIVEDVLEPKTAYLCYQLEGPPDDTQGGFQQVEVNPLQPQIVSNQEAKTTKEDLQRLHDVEFQKTKPVKTGVTNSQPVLEDVIESKTTYLCYNPDKEATTSQAIANLDVFDENDDGWGCGFEEAHLEDDHRQRMDNPPMIQNVNLRVEQLDDRIRVLELERERHLEELKQSQVKCGKLIKKLKEFKALNERLTSDLRKSSSLGGLDDAIQDELQSQIGQLEKKAKESSVELEKEKNDKSNLLKRIETLQVANERLTEIKEKQDIDMISWQRQNRELSSKLEQLEWGDDGFDSPKHGKSEQQATADPNSNFENKIQELTGTVKELILDNEELQVMLEEQRSLRINAEKAKSVEPIPENMKTEAEYLNVVAEKNQVNEQLLLSVEEKKNLQEEFNNLLKTSGALQQTLESLTEEKSQFEISVAQNNSMTQELRTQLLSLQKENENLCQARTELQTDISEQDRIKIADLEQKNIELNNNLQTLQAEIQQLYSECDHLSELKASISTLSEEKVELFNVLQEKNIEIENLNEKITQYNKQIMELEEKLSLSQILADENKEIVENLKLKDAELANITNKLDAALEERSVLSESIQQLADEWSQRVDQRGADVAESWKLHLESRESEFLQLEQQLKKETNELEEKCNALVNENNELRKNVDAEIRNEVDRISALQQQINDRQRYVNDLTIVVQENQTKLEEQHQKLTAYEGITLQLNEQIQERDVKIAEAEAKTVLLQQTVEELTLKLHDFETLQQQLIGNQQMTASLQEDLKEKQDIISECMQKLDNYAIEIDHYKETHMMLQQQMQEKDLYISEITSKLQELQLQKENEVSANIQMLQQQIDQLNFQLQEKQTQVETTNQQLSVYKQFNEDGQVKDIELTQLKAEIASLLEDKTRLNLHLQEKHGESEMYSQQFTQNLATKDMEINQLKLEIDHIKTLLNEKEKEYAFNLETTSQENENVFHEKEQELDILKRKQAETEYCYDELIMAKDSDMENLRLQLQEQLQRNENLTQNYQEAESTLNEFKIQLDLKEQECEELHNTMFNQDSLLNEENKQLSELREIIEDQVLKIEALKQELFEKSKDYDSLIAELDIRKPARSEPGTPLQERPEQYYESKASEISSVRQNLPTEDDTLEPISRAELDIALYMLHQRDVRCEELTVELMQLLEERDTLQLKLSNSLREKEELRSRFLPLTTTPDSTDGSSITKTPSTPTGTIPKSKASAIVLGATGTELATEATEHLQGEKDTHSLANKLSELRSVGYRRDKTLLDEQDHRRLQQLSVMQQHRDAAAMLPPEAAARLVHEAGYTLSRDVQSPSRVLLNWLWGRSTPKVNNI